MFMSRVGWKVWTLDPAEPSWRFGRRLSSQEIDTAVRHLSKADPKLRALIGRVGKLRVRGGLAPYEALVVSILYQQLAGSAADAITSRFKGLFGGHLPLPAQLLNEPDSNLRGAGLSRRKVEYLKDLSRRVVDGSLDLESLPSKGDEEIISILDEVKGIGRWTAQMFLIFPLCRLDVLPTGDLGIRAAVQELYGLDELPSEIEVGEIASDWHPYCTVASLYLWRLGELDDPRPGG
jgi:DNA-3-methyladenine glycosylase II